MTNKSYIIAVDGPAGSGKSALCAKACQHLNWAYITTGFLYRAIAFIIRERHINYQNEKELLNILNEFSENFKWHYDSKELWFKGQEISAKLQTVEISSDASLIATLPLVREKLLPVQRKLAITPLKGVMMDGRDIGTVVFPDADLKIFVTASIEVRAQRRLQQLKRNGDDYNDIMTIKEAIRVRDEQDSNRSIAPLVKAADAIEFNNDFDGMEQAVTALVNTIKKSLKLG